MPDGKLGVFTNDSDPERTAAARKYADLLRQQTELLADGTFDDRAFLCGVYWPPQTVAINWAAEPELQILLPYFQRATSRVASEDPQSGGSVRTLWQLTCDRIADECCITGINSAVLGEYADYLESKGPRQSDEMTVEMARLNEIGIVGRLIRGIVENYPEESRELGLVPIQLNGEGTGKVDINTADLIDIESFYELARVEQKTIENKYKSSDRPKAIVRAAKNRKAEYSYSEYRAWLIQRQPAW